MFKLIKNLFTTKTVKAEPRTNRNGKVVLADMPHPSEGRAMVTANKYVYPKNTRFEADPDIGGVMPKGAPAGVVIHHTVSYDLNGTVNYFKKNFVDVHFVIGHGGEIVQMAPVNRVCDHAGISEWGNLKYLNNWFVGIEVVNLGPLTKTASGFKDAYGRKYTGPVRERKMLGLQYWEPFTAAQEKAVMDICVWLNKEHGISVSNMVGHYEVSVGRKNDPAGGFAAGGMSEVRRLLSAHIKDAA